MSRGLLAGASIQCAVKTLELSCELAFSISLDATDSLVTFAWRRYSIGRWQTRHRAGCPPGSIMRDDQNSCMDG